MMLMVSDWMPGSEADKFGYFLAFIMKSIWG